MRHTTTAQTELERTESTDGGDVTCTAEDILQALHGTGDTPEEATPLVMQRIDEHEEGEADEKAAARSSLTNRANNFRNRNLPDKNGQQHTDKEDHLRGFAAKGTTQPSLRSICATPGAVAVHGPGRRQSSALLDPDDTSSVDADDSPPGKAIVASVVDEEETTKLKEELEQKEAELKEMRRSLEEIRSVEERPLSVKPVSKPQEHLTDAEQAALDILLGDDTPEAEASACCVIS